VRVAGGPPPHVGGYSGSGRAIPKGLCPPAQGCEERATLGTAGDDDNNPEGVASTCGRLDTQGIEARTLSGLTEPRQCIPKVARSSQPWAEGHNPFGIKNGRSCFITHNGFATFLSIRQFNS